MYTSEELEIIHGAFLVAGMYNSGTLDKLSRTLRADVLNHLHNSSAMLVKLATDAGFSIDEEESLLYDGQLIQRVK